MMFPKTTPVRLKGNAMRTLRLQVFMRDLGRCVVCNCMVSFNGNSDRFPPMHLHHKRSKRLYGDTLENTECLCANCHLVGKHNPKSVPPKNGGANVNSLGSR